MIHLVFLKKILWGNKGSSTVIVSMAVVALIGFCSLVLDMGNLFLAKNRLSNALDAAVLAGAQELPDAAAQAPDKAQDYFTSHGFNVADLLSIDVSPDGKTITASGRTTVEYAMAKVLGINSADVNCAAAARIEPLTAVSGVVPVGIREQELDFGQEYELKMASNNNFSEYLGPGNFGVLALSGSNSSSVYEQDFMNGYSGKIKIGDEIETAQGNMSGATRDGVNHRVTQCTHDCDQDSFNPSCPRVIIIPVYVPEDVHNNKVNSVRIVGFATFLLSVPTGKMVGNESYVRGRFVKMTLNGDSDEEQTGFGAYSARLIL